MRKAAQLLVRYFFQGIIIVSPLAITAWAAYSIFDFLDLKNENWPRGIGFLMVVGSIVIIGWLGSTFLVWKFLIDLFDGILERTPFIKFIYTSVKDVVESFMGDKKKFTKPVLVRVRHEPDIYQIGFITQKDVTRLGLVDYMAVYMPHSYAVSGFVYFVPIADIKSLDINASEAMKMAVSGGVAGYGEEEKPKENQPSSH